MDAPIMPLGPTPLDNAVGNDHIAAAIGAAFMGYYKCAHIINAISPSEHSTSVFTSEDLIQAVISARIAANSININKFADCKESNDSAYFMRAAIKSCLVANSDFCTRCDALCPLKFNNYE